MNQRNESMIDDTRSALADELDDYFRHDYFGSETRAIIKRAVAALRSAPVSAHKIKTDGPACQTCGFKVTSRKHKPFQIEED